MGEISLHYLVTYKVGKWIKFIHEQVISFTYSADEYIVGSGEMEDLFILLTNPAMSCLQIEIIMTNGTSVSCSYMKDNENFLSKD